MTDLSCRRIGLAALVALCGAAAAEGETILHRGGDWIALHDPGNPDPGLHSCSAMTETPNSVLMLSVYTDGQQVLGVSHAGWNAPDHRVDARYQIVIDGRAPWTIRASMRGRIALTRIDPGNGAFRALGAALARGGEVTLRSEDGRLLDRFSLRGSSAALAELDRCAAELLPQEWGDEEDAGTAGAALPQAALPQAALPQADVPEGWDATHLFSQFPPEARLRGAPVAPDFGGRDADYRSMRTRIREAVAAGVSYAGHYAMVEAGCGTSCRFAMVVDLRTGEVGGFPYGGEENYQMTLLYRPDSRLLKVRWRDPARREVCIEQDMLIEGMDWQVLDERTTPSDDGYCD